MQSRELTHHRPHRVDILAIYGLLHITCLHTAKYLLLVEEFQKNALKWRHTVLDI